MSHIHYGTAYGLDSIADEHWSHHGVWARPDVPADLWCSDYWDHRATALHICRQHCRVLAQCAAETQKTSEQNISQVVGGVAYTQRGVVSRAREASVCWLCAPMAMPLVTITDSKSGRPRGGKELRPCGTEAAYQRHRNRGELLDDDCQEAHRQYLRERRAARDDAAA